MKTIGAHNYACFIFILIRLFTFLRHVLQRTENDYLKFRMFLLRNLNKVVVSCVAIVNISVCQLIASHFKWSQTNKIEFSSPEIVENLSPKTRTFIICQAIFKHQNEWKWKCALVIRRNSFEFVRQAEKSSCTDSARNIRNSWRGKYRCVGAEFLTKAWIFRGGCLARRVLWNGERRWREYEFFFLWKYIEFSIISTKRRKIAFSLLNAKTRLTFFSFLRQNGLIERLKLHFTIIECTAFN